MKIKQYNQYHQQEDINQILLFLNIRVKVKEVNFIGDLHKYR